QRLADVRQDRGAGTSTGIGLRGTKPDRGAEFDRAPDIRARFLADEVGKATRHFPFVGPRERAEQHVGDHEAEYVIAEKFQPLIGTGTVAGAGQRRNMGERLLEQSRILEAISDSLFEFGGAAAPPL